MREVAKAIRKHVAGPLADRIFDPGKPLDDPQGLAFAVAALRDAIVEPPENLLPLMPVCDGSFACVVCDRDILDPTLDEGEAFEVIRWHLGLVDPEKQGDVLDLNPIDYLESFSREVGSREGARKAVDRAAQDYYSNYVVRQARPRPDALRPIQLACQNVIIGLAALRHDAVFDGLRVEAYATCETAHLATGEADRSLAALLLCDAFQSGGTMEIRFGRPGSGERPIPHALRRFARVRGLDLGTRDRCSISPKEARDLFLAVTPMSEELRYHAFSAFDAGRISPERLCYALMAGVWGDIELTFLLGTTSRAAAILDGGSDPVDRLARSAEAESCRAAVMVGTLLSRLHNMSEAQGADTVEIIEDSRREVIWATRPELAAVAFGARPGRSIPWVHPGSLSRLAEHHEAIVVLPRPMPQRTDADLLDQIQREQQEAAVFLLVPEGVEMNAFDGVPYMTCPQTLDILDQIVRTRLDTMRIARR
ncbi:MAG: hypothetical protein KDK08_22525 [Rhizobiaceae bacterium]|nr:hypothetical protein [Rhizobiaceae bacterium]